jgi:hypothetical protein
MTCGHSAPLARPECTERPRPGLSGARAPECTAKEAVT